MRRGFNWLKTGKSGTLLWTQ